MIGALTANARADWGPWLDDVCPGLREELPDVIPEAEAVPFPAIQAFCNPADTISGPRDGSLDWAARRSPHPVNTSHASTPLQNTPILVDSSVASSSGDEQEFGGIIGGEENEETDEDKEDDEDAEESDESGENDGAAKVTDAATKSVPASVDEDVEMAGLSTSGSSDIPLALAVPLTTPGTTISPSAPHPVTATPAPQVVPPSPSIGTRSRSSRPTLPIPDDVPVVPHPLPTHITHVKWLSLKATPARMTEWAESQTAQGLDRVSILCLSSRHAKLLF